MDASQQKLVAIVDDDILFSEMASASLSNHGYRCLVANSGQEALNLVASKSPDIVLCDVQMPDLDGYTVCEWIRSSENHSDTPCVMLTGQDDIESIESAFSAGATHFISKPVNWALLPREVQFVLRSSDAFKALRVSEERYSLAAEATRDALWDWDVAANEVYFSPRWQRMLGMGGNRFRGEPEVWLSRIHDEDRQRVRREINNYFCGGQSTFSTEYRIEHSSGSYLWVLLHGKGIRDASGAVTRFAGSQSDITEKKEFDLKLQFAALHDSLTGLFNRHAFNDRIENLWECSEPGEARRPSLVYVDLDRFKAINDNCGHVAGDVVLQSTADAIHEVAPECALVSRIGGDEFTVLFDGSIPSPLVLDTAKQISERLREITVDDSGLFVTASIGVALSSRKDADMEALVQRTDLAMYRAKQAGGDRVSVCDGKGKCWTMGSPVPATCAKPDWDGHETVYDHLPSEAPVDAAPQAVETEV